MLDIFIRAPWLAFVVAVIFSRLAVARRSRLTAAASCAWLLYGIYEYLMRVRVLCTGECNIRVDLLLIYPGLLMLSIAALIATLKPRQRG